MHADEIPRYQETTQIDKVYSKQTSHFGNCLVSRHLEKCHWVDGYGLSD